MKIGPLLKKLGIRFLILFLLFLGAMSIVNCSGQRSLRAELRRWEQAGLMLDVERDADDPAWRAAEAAYVELIDSEALEMLVDGPLREAAQRGEALRVTAELRQRIADAAAAPGPVPVPQADDPEAQMAYRLHALGLGRAFARVLDGAARTQAAEGDATAAAATLRAMIALGERVGADATLAAHQARLRIDEITLDALHAIHADPGFDILAALRADLEAVDHAGAFADMLRGEARLMFAWMRQQQDVLITRGWWQHDVRYMLEQQRALIEPLQSGTPLREIEIVTDEDAHPWWAQSVDIALPMLENARVSTIRAAARRNQALVAARLRDHRRATGAYPATLDAVLPAGGDAALLDPHTGEPFRYERTDGGFVLTSDVEGEPIRWGWER
ncbi:MAG: hypothetical protein WD009_05850 [Phycisphaeraceae bacterium]